MGELHLEVLTRRIDEDFGVDVRVGAPRVVYRETLAKESSAEFTLRQGISGRAPVRQGAGWRGAQSWRRCLVQKRGGGSENPRERNHIRAGISLRASTSSGAMAVYEMTDVSITLLEADYDAQRATEAAFSIAAANAFTEACRTAGGQLLEPVMSVEVVTPRRISGRDHRRHQCARRKNGRR